MKVLVAAGGTGGHLFPAMAVVEQVELLTQGRCAFEFVGTADRIEAELVPKAGYPFHSIPIRGLGKTFSLTTAALPFNILRSVHRCRNIIKNFQPDLVLCTGAYISYPAGLAAGMMGVPLYLLESNANPGKAIKMLSGRAELLFSSFEETEEYYPENRRGNIMLAGNPIRKGFVPPPDTAEARRAFGLDPQKITLLCFGGSLGARTINQVVESNLAAIVERGAQVIWQTGKLYEPGATATTMEGVKILRFIDDMPAAYAAANLIVCRSGATTVAEITAVGKASVLVPLPSASNDEQARNAEVLVREGAAVMIRDKVLAEKFSELVPPLLADPPRLQAMARKAHELGRPDAARTIARELLRRHDSPGLAENQA